MFTTTGSRALRKRISSGTPGGAFGSVQFNNSGSFGGFGFYDGSAILSISGTAQALRVYNAVDNALTPTNYERGVFDFITTANTLTIGTQSGGSGVARDVAISSASVNLYLEGSFSGAGNISINCKGGNNVFAVFGNSVFNGVGSFAGIYLGNAGIMAWSSTAGIGSSFDTSLNRRAAGVLSIQDPSSLTTATGFQIYNTVDTQNTAPTNYERGVFDWTTTANTLTIGQQAGGTGASRNINFVFAGNSAASNFNFGSASGTTSIFCIYGAGPATYAANLQVNSLFAWTPNANANSNGDTGLCRLAQRVVGFGDGITNPPGANSFSGWFQWTGQQRVTSDFSRANSTTATAITGLSSVSVAIVSGTLRNYKFEAWLATAGSTAGGISIAITCTSSTITALSVDGFILDSNVVRGQQGVITSTTTPVVNSSAITSSAPTVRLQGLIRGVSSGTFGLSLAQSTSNATAVVVSSGSWLEVFDVP